MMDDELRKTDNYFGDYEELAEELEKMPLDLPKEMTLLEQLEQLALIKELALRCRDLNRKLIDLLVAIDAKMDLVREAKIVD